MKKYFILITLAVLMTLSCITVFAAEVDGVEMPLADAAASAAKIDTGDTAWVLVSAALVMIMTPALALFYGGMVRTKNVLNTIMQSFFIVAMVSVQWVLWGYSLAFGPDFNHLIGDLSWAGLAGVGREPNSDYAATIPHLAFVAFQCMFAVITPALITGAFAERMRFPAFAVFSLIWTTLVYDPFAHWVWGIGGWLRDLGALDFAGGTVIHILSGVSGLVACVILGKRKGYGNTPMLPHHLPMTVLGAALLWFGWFGFNAGSALGANDLAANAFVVTNTAAAAAGVSWVISEWLHRGKPTIFGAASGCVAGLVAITPAAGFVAAGPAVIIGVIAGVICYGAVSIVKHRFGYDDALDAFGVHGVGGTWGAIATGLFASKAINPAGSDGLLYGNPELLPTQLLATGAAWLFGAFMTFIILKALALVIKLRVDEHEESIGLDLSEHGERGYAYQDLVAGFPVSQGAVAVESPTRQSVLAFESKK